MKDRDTGRMKKKIIVFFESVDKGLVLNVTNKNMLTDALGKPPADWLGATIGIFVDPNVGFGGKKTGGVRLRVLLPIRAAAKAGSRSRQPERHRLQGRWRVRVLIRISTTACQNSQPHDSHNYRQRKCAAGIFSNGSKPMTPHLTTTDRALDASIRATPPGMAFWAGTCCLRWLQKPWCATIE